LSRHCHSLFHIPCVDVVPREFQFDPRAQSRSAEVPSKKFDFPHIPISISRPEQILGATIEESVQFYCSRIQTEVLQSMPQKSDCRDFLSYSVIHWPRKVPDTQTAIFSGLTIQDKAARANLSGPDVLRFYPELAAPCICQCRQQLCLKMKWHSASRCLTLGISGGAQRRPLHAVVGRLLTPSARRYLSCPLAFSHSDCFCCLRRSFSSAAWLMGFSSTPLI